MDHPTETPDAEPAGLYHAVADATALNCSQLLGEQAGFVLLFFRAEYPNDLQLLSSVPVAEVASILQGLLERMTTATDNTRRPH